MKDQNKYQPQNEIDRMLKGCLGTGIGFAVLLAIAYLIFEFLK